MQQTKIPFSVTFTPTTFEVLISGVKQSETAGLLHRFRSDSTVKLCGKLHTSEEDQIPTLIRYFKVTDKKIKVSQVLHYTTFNGNLTGISKEDFIFFLKKIFFKKRDEKSCSHLASFCLDKADFDGSSADFEAACLDLLHKLHCLSTQEDWVSSLSSWDIVLPFYEKFLLAYRAFQQNAAFLTSYRINLHNLTANSAFQICATVENTGTNFCIIDPNHTGWGHLDKNLHTFSLLKDNMDLHFRDLLSSHP